MYLTLFSLTILMLAYASRRQDTGLARLSALVPFIRPALYMFEVRPSSGIHIL